ncbi:flagellar export protein FliJ [Cohnella faecalis]|uniref:Flagellar FliJ protein n=1 Tax=Cohnella faecalis TaxID=2315694 RepID=A0A398CLH9_9BACL|nr:flagellar export protein FliJ [Cohnella faecalis]RIE03285.1 flagellar export protein FliJ [Cohnella faecalis]
MRFRYSMQKIVDLKGSEKSMAEWEYAASLGRLRAEEERLEQLLNERESVESRLVAASSEPIPLSELLTLQQYIDVLNERIRRQRNGVETAADQAGECRNRLKDRMVDEKVWLNAREKALVRFRTEWLAKEQNELDEIAITRAAAAASG